MLQRKRPVRRGTALMLTLLLCGFVSIVHRQSTRLSDPVLGTVRDMALVPGQLLTVHLGRWWHDTVTACFQGPALARRNRAMTAQVHGLLAQNKDLLTAQAENVRLRRLLRFQGKSPVPLLAAEVIAIDPNPQTETLVLARGRADHVRPQTVVLAPNGTLVGQVLDVSSRSCSVLLITDNGSSVGAQVVRRISSPASEDSFLQGIDMPGPASSVSTKMVPVKNGAVGICQGDRAGHLNLTYLSAEADVQAGDLITTSGLGGVFPKGVTIGTVEAVTIDKSRSVKTAHVRPAADLDHLEEAFLRLKHSAISESSTSPDEAAP